MKEVGIESKVAATILQQKEEIRIGDSVYYAAPPSIATLILASEAVSRLPHKVFDNKKVAAEVLANAPDCKPLGEIVAILILGAKEVDKKVPVAVERKKRYLWGLFKRNVKRTILRSNREILAEKILETHSPKELDKLLSRLLDLMQIGSFFGLTTFLIEANMLKQTKVEE